MDQNRRANRAGTHPCATDRCSERAALPPGSRPKARPLPRRAPPPGPPEGGGERLKSSTDRCSERSALATNGSRKAHPLPPRQAHQSEKTNGYARNSGNSPPEQAPPATDAPPREGPRESPPAPSVGATIRARREALGLTLEALAEAARCAKSYLSEIERGRRPAPGEALLARLEHALALAPGDLVERGRWEHAPPGLRRQLARLASERRAAGRLAELVSTGAGGGAGAAGRASGSGLGASLDDAWRTGELARLVERLAPDTGSAQPGAGLPVARLLPQEVPLINSVAAGLPTEFTDLGYPARVADEYVRCAPLDDPDAFAARVVGDSMSPQYTAGDIVVFSPARPIRSGMDCFARLEPDNETTFKRVYFQTSQDGRELIRLQPLNAEYPARVLDREQVAGLYAAVSVTREL